MADTTARPVALDNSFESLQLRLRKGELVCPDLDESNRRRQLAGLLPRATEVIRGAVDSEKGALRHES